MKSENSFFPKDSCEFWEFKVHKLRSSNRNFRKTAVSSDTRKLYKPLSKVHIKVTKDWKSAVEVSAILQPQHCNFQTFTVELKFCLEEIKSKMFSNTLQKGL